jgi:ribosomal protein L15
MQHVAFKRTSFVALALLLAMGEPAYAKKMYRWVDENGNVYFSDQVPPDQVKHKRETLSEKARVLDVLEKAKTAEQIAQQKRLDALRKEQEKIIARQNANDKVLLSTFRSIEDMNKALTNKMASFDAGQKVIEGNIERIQQQLQQQQQQAANLERGGSKIPPKLLADIAASKQQIEAGKSGSRYFCRKIFSSFPAGKNRQKLRDRLCLRRPDSSASPRSDPARGRNIGSRMT